MTAIPTISVIVPTLNGAATLGAFFAALKVQSIAVLEVLAVDSSSSDDSVEICRRFGAQVIPIPRESFDHGGTRTMAAGLARGDILVFFTQDAILADRHSLGKLVRPLCDDDRVACAYGRQLPAADADPIAAHLRLFNYPPQSQLRSLNDRECYGLKTAFISNSFAAYKKDVLASCDFFKNGLIFGEDTCTLGRILLAGYKVAYVAEAEVYHSHNYHLGEEFRRAFDIGVLHGREEWLLATYGRAEGVGRKYLFSLLSRMVEERRFFLLADCLLRSALKFLGYKLGQNHRRLPSSLCPLLSMNRLWWQRQENGQRR